MVVVWGVFDAPWGGTTSSCCRDVFERKKVEYVVVTGRGIFRREVTRLPREQRLKNCQNPTADRRKSWNMRNASSPRLRKR